MLNQLETATGTPAQRSVRLLLMATLFAIVTIGASIAVRATTMNRSELAWLLVIFASIATFVTFAWAAVRALVSLLSGAQGKLSFISTIVFSIIGSFVTLTLLVGFTRGRQLRRAGKVLLPEVDEGDAWSHLALQPVVPAEAREALAAQWRENGRTEHASVAAFAQVTLDLMALGAPPALLAGAQRDALDEIRHAQLCFSLARALDGQAQSPTAFPQAAKTRALSSARELALAQVAIDSLIEGALLEGFSARLISKLITRCEDPATTAVLKELAADEGRHSRHGWDVVDWCVSQGGAGVVHALMGAVAALPNRSKSAVSPEAHFGAWERYGISGALLEHQTYLEARAHVVERVEAMRGT